MMNHPMYKEIFDELSSIEKKLDKPLDFDVQLDYIVLNSFKESFTSDELKTLADTIGIRIFEFINDLSLRKNIYETKSISDKYLYNDTLKQLKEYYETNHELILDCFKKGYSSLPLYDVLYDSKYHNSLLSEIYKVLENPELCKRKKELTYGLIIYVENELHLIQSEKLRDEFYYEMRLINKNYNKILQEDICSLSDISIEKLCDIVNPNS